MSIDKDHDIGLSPRSWPPRKPSDAAEAVAAKELAKGVREHLRSLPQHQNEESAIALSRLGHRHLNTMIGYDIDRRCLEVIIGYKITLRHKINNLEIALDDRLPKDGVSTVINGMDPLDRPVVADSLTWEYLDSLRDDEYEKGIAVLSDESVCGTNMRELKRQLRSLQDELQRIHRQIYTGTLEQT